MKIALACVWITAAAIIVWYETAPSRPSHVVTGTDGGR